MMFILKISKRNLSKQMLKTSELQFLEGDAGQEFTESLGTLL
jgi:hypothetical protein